MNLVKLFLFHSKFQTIHIFGQTFNLNYFFPNPPTLKIAFLYLKFRNLNLAKWKHIARNFLTEKSDIPRVYHIFCNLTDKRTSESIIRTILDTFEMVALWRDAEVFPISKNRTLRVTHYSLNSGLLSQLVFVIRNAVLSSPL